MKRTLFFLGIFAMISTAVFVVGRKSTAQSERETKLEPETMRQIHALIRDKESRSPVQQKIDSQLLYANKLRQRPDTAVEVPTLQVNVGADDRGMVDVVIIALIDAKLLASLSKMGIEVKANFSQYNSLTVSMSLDKLEAVASMEQVRFIQPKQGFRRSQKKSPRSMPQEFSPHSGSGSDQATGIASQIQQAVRNRTEPETAVQHGIAVSQGDATHRAFRARGTFNTDGSGVKIGVISDGVNNLAAAQASGDLGNVTVLPNQQGFGDEGTAMLEIVHDIAPGAQLYFASGTNNGIAGFAQNIRDLRNAGCDIIVDDIAYYVESPFQDGQASNVVSTRNGGVVTQAVNDVVASGALYFSSAGNSGNKNDDTSAVWEGDFINGGPLSPAPEGFPTGNVLDFDPTEGVAQFNTIILGAESPITLHWADPLGASANDYDIYVINQFGGLMTFSNNSQTGTQDPYEQIGILNQTSFRIVIVQKPGAASRFMHLDNFDGQLGYSTNGEIHGHAASSGGIGVAATAAIPTFPGAFTTTNEVELFSSDGPRRIFFNSNGTPITPGNLTATGGTVLQQPLLTAADGVSISGAGEFSNPFFGTSAAAPHAAAIAALLKAANPALNSTQIKTALTSTAVDIEGPGVDQDSGHGIIMADRALQSLGGPVVGKAFLEIGAVTQTETCCNGDGYLVRSEAGTLTIPLKNSGMQDANGITATLTTSNPNVTIQNGHSAYPDIALSNEYSTNITPFTVSLGPNLPADPRIKFTLTLNYSGGHGLGQVWDFDVQFGFQPVAFDPGASSTVYAIAVQPDGKILVGGTFSGLAGLAGQIRNGIGRLNADGTLDTTFNPGSNNRVFCIAVQPDGKIVVGGRFTRIGNAPRSRIARLNADGTLEAGFNPGASNDNFAEVYALLVQPDGKILVGGDITTLGGQPRRSIGRLNADGSLDTSFNPGADWPVRSFTLQLDGKIVIVGDFETVGGGGSGTTPRKKIARLNNDGTVDPTFNPGANNPIWAIAQESNGRFVVSGFFSALGGGTGTTPRNGHGRINPDGTLDNSFYGATYVSPQVFGIQTDRQIIVAGQFAAYGGVPVPNFIARLNYDSTLDNTFEPGANNIVFALALQGDGMVLAGGDFTTLGRGGLGLDPRRRIGRVSNTSVAVQQLSVNFAGTAVTWLRGGTSPEVYRVTFESSSDGTNYTLLGNGTRIDGGWQLAGLALNSQHRYIRARGFYTTGIHNGSGSIVESVKDRGPLPTTISGRVLTPSGIGIRNTIVHLTNSQGVRRTATTSSFGFYTFDNVTTGGTYIIGVSSKQYRFSPRSLLITSELANLDFLGLE